MQGVTAWLARLAEFSEAPRCGGGKRASPLLGELPLFDFDESISGLEEPWMGSVIGREKDCGIGTVGLSDDPKLLTFLGLIS